MTHEIQGREGRRGLALLAGALLVVGCLLARENPPEVPPPKPLKLPVPSVVKLTNGMQVVDIERRTLPILTLRLLVQSGAESDPSRLPGTAQLTAQVLSQGTSRRSAREISDAVDAIGAQLLTGAEWDHSYAEITVLSPQAEEAFDLLSDLVLHPTFPSEEIERKRQQTLSALQVLHDDPAYMAESLFHVLVFAGTPYGHPLDGTVDTVRRLSRRDVQQFHRLHYRPDNCILAIVGDIGRVDAIARTEKAFGGWKGSAVPRAPSPARAGRGKRPHMVVVDKPDAVQTEIRAGYPGVSRASPEYYALTVANQVLGGPAVNRLFRELRSRRGLAYGASSELTFQQSAGSWMAKTSTRTSETVRSLRGVLDELHQLRSNHVRAHELRMAKSYLVGHLALEFETSEDVAAQFLELLEYRLPLAYWNDFPGKVYAIGADEVSAVTRKLFDDDRQTIVLVGDASAFSKELRSLGPFQTIPLQTLDLASPDLTRPAR